MRKIVFILCFLSITVLFSACNSGSDKGSGGGAVPVVSFEMINSKMICYNSTSSIITGSFQTCTWNCAKYAQFPNPANWIIIFNLAPKLTDPTSTADYTYNVQDPLPCK